MILVFSIIGVVVLLIGGIAYVAYQRSSGGGSLTGTTFYLAYDNPTENTYYIVLDEWDTVKVNPFTTCSDMDYKHRRDVTTYNWKILDDQYNLIADTSVTDDEVNRWMSDRTAYSWATSTVLFNPSRTQYVYYTRWYDEEGADYMGDVEVGDTTLYFDGYTVSDAFIFDERDTEFQTEMENAAHTSSLDQNQFLVNRYDFVVLYNKFNYDNPQQQMMEDYHYMLSELFENAREEVLANSRYGVEDVTTCYDLDSLTPYEVTSTTEPRDFIDAIEFVKENSSLFRSAAPDEYNWVVDSADVLLKRSYTQNAPMLEYMDMTIVSYYVEGKGFLGDQLVREESYSYERSVGEIAE